MNIARGVHTDFDIDVLLTSNKTGYYDAEFETYGRIYRVNCAVDGFGPLKKYLSFFMRPFKQFFYARKLIKTNGYDIVHIHTGLEGGPMFLAARSAGVKTIIAHSHNTASPEKRSIPSRIYRHINKYIIHRCATARIGVSLDANQYLYGFDESYIVNNPVELDKFTTLDRARQEGMVSLVNVGRYCYQKNQSFILEIVNSLIKSGLNVQLSLVGFGEDETMLSTKIHQYRLENIAQLIRGDGDVDIPAILSSSDVFVFPSRFEGLGIVLIEAQAAGCLCIASDSVPDTTDLGMCEYFSLNEDADAWAYKIIDMLSQRERYCIDKDRMSLYKAENIQNEIRVFYHNLVSS